VGREAGATFPTRRRYISNQEALHFQKEHFHTAKELARLVPFWQKRIEQEETGADDNGGVGYVEVREVIAEDVDFNEVDDRAVKDAVVYVAQSAGKDEREGDSGEGESIA
jgi:hypothetical protein